MGFDVDIAECVENLVAENKRLKEEYRRSKWHPCWLSLPPNNGIVLVTVGIYFEDENRIVKHVTRAHYMGDFWKIELYTSAPWEVLAWMEEPEPYEGEVYKEVKSEQTEVQGRETDKDDPSV